MREVNIFFSLRHPYHTVSPRQHSRLLISENKSDRIPSVKLPIINTVVGLQKVQFKLVIQPSPSFDLTFSLKLASRDTRDPWGKKRPPQSLIHIHTLLHKTIILAHFYLSQPPESQCLHTGHMHDHKSNNLGQNTADASTHQTAGVLLTISCPYWLQSLNLDLATSLLQDLPWGHTSCVRAVCGWTCSS